MYLLEGLVEGLVEAPPFWKVSRPPGAAQTPQIDDFRPVKIRKHELFFENSWIGGSRQVAWTTFDVRLRSSNSLAVRVTLKRSRVGNLGSSFACLFTRLVVGSCGLKMLGQHSQ